MSKAKLNIAGKINTVPKQLSVEEIEMATKMVHQPAFKEIPIVSPIVPIVEKRVEKTIVAKEKKVRLSIDISPQLHKKLKIRAVENDTNVMHYVEKLLEQHLNA